MIKNIKKKKNKKTKNKFLFNFNFNLIYHILPSYIITPIIELN